MTKSTGEDWLGVPALARELGITMRTLYKLLDAGELPAYKFGAGDPHQAGRRRGVPRAGRR